MRLASTYKVYMKFLTTALALLVAACGNPGGVTDEEYKQYKTLGSPKILYSCTTTTEWIITDKGQEELQACDSLKGLFATERCQRELLSKPPVDDTIVSYIAGRDFRNTYNSLLTEVKNRCEGYKKGRFEILESEQ